MGKVLLVALWALTLRAEQPLAWHKVEGAKTNAAYVELRSGTTPILRYNYGVQLPPGVPEDRARCCYIYPLWTPGGVSPLDDFPKDHYHHRGLFWAWPDVRVAGTQYDGWMIKGLKTLNKSWHSELQKAGHVAVLDVDNEWLADEKTIATAQERYVIHAREGQSRTIEAVLTLTATEARIALRGSHEQGKSYGGLSVRFAPRTQTVIRTEKGVLEKDDDLNTHEWA